MHRAAIAFLLLSSLPAIGSAQEGEPFTCSGQLVSRVVVQPLPPPFAGASKKWRAAANAVGLHHATTRRYVISAFLSLSEGKPCTEFRRSESERVLRAQPFLSDASVRVVPDTGGFVAVFVKTTDEVPVLITGRFRGIVPVSFTLGNENIAGEALRLEGRIEGGGAFRTAYGGRFEWDALARKPYRLVLVGDRYRVGQVVGAEIEHPFFTNLQWISWHAGIAVADNYLPFERPARDPLALRVNDRTWDVSSLTRLFGTATVALLGGAVAGRHFDPASFGVVLSDSGLMPDTGTALRNRYSPFKVVRIGVTGGLRRATFQTVNGFDALVGSQDVQKGATLGVYIAKGLPQFGESDALVSGALYLGAANRNSLLATLVQAEVRRDLALDEWDSAIGSARTAFYWGSAPGTVFLLDNELSGGWRPRLPLQLSFRNLDGGLIGYRNSALAGGQRSVTRAEIRWSAASLLRGADVGFGTFGELGQLWRGDVPYGVNVTRAAVGVSLLAAYPSRSKRLYRLDLAIPLTRSGPGAGRMELLFSNFDRTHAFWREPIDLARARTGAEPSRLFAWPIQ